MAAPAVGYRLIQMNLREPTIKKVEELKETLGASTRTDVIRTAIDVLYLVATAVKYDKKTVVFEAPDGTRDRVVIPGLL